MKFIVYYRKFGGRDAFIKYGGLKVMQFDLKHEKAKDFDYINACTLCEDGSEEIVFNSLEEILNAI